MVECIYKGYGRKKSSYVSCGECVACCTSSNFVHIRPTDKDALGRIPKEIIFSAPGLPKGHFLLGYNEKRHCPMFKAGKCSIYEYRPETCRQYDCRVYSATRVSLDEKKSKIAIQVERWRFDMPSSCDLEKFSAVQQAAVFLLKYRARFPTNCVIRTNSQLAVIAIRIHKIFIGQELSRMENDVKGVIDSIVLKYGNNGKK